MSTLDKLEELENEEITQDSSIKPFRGFQEEAIISLALDVPDFFASIAKFLKPDMFKKLETKWIIAEILNIFEKHSIVPTRAILRDHLEGKLNVDDPHVEIMRLVDRKSDYREIPIVKELLLEWARKKAFGLIYTPEAIEAYKEGNYNYIENLFNEANKIVDFSSNTGLWFFENIDLLFKEDLIEHRTTGFPRLDAFLNNGGPSPKEVVCWLAPTNVGKCHTLQSKIFEERLSRIYEIELEDGTVKKIAGFRKVKTTRGLLRVCDLTDADDIELILFEDIWDIVL